MAVRRCLQHTHTRTHTHTHHPHTRAFPVSRAPSPARPCPYSQARSSFSVGTLWRVPCRWARPRARPRMPSRKLPRVGPLFACTTQPLNTTPANLHNRSTAPPCTWILVRESQHPTRQGSESICRRSKLIKMKTFIGLGAPEDGPMSALSTQLLVWLKTIILLLH